MKKVEEFTRIDFFGNDIIVMTKDAIEIMIFLKVFGILIENRISKIYGSER